MRLSNNIHNICELEGAQLVQEWKEEEKIPVKKAKPQPTPPKKEEAKTDEAAPPKEGETAGADAGAAPADGKANGEAGPQAPPAEGQEAAAQEPPKE